MTTQRLIGKNDSIYLEHILHGQVETQSFWLNQMIDWKIDPLGNNATRTV